MGDDIARLWVNTPSRSPGHDDKNVRRCPQHRIGGWTCLQSSCRVSITDPFYDCLDLGLTDKTYIIDNNDTDGHTVPSDQQMGAALLPWLKEKEAHTSS